MKRIVAFAMGALLSTAAQAELNSPLVPIASAQGGTEAVGICYLTNTSSYRRTGVVTVQGRDGIVAVTVPYDIPPRESTQAGFAVGTYNPFAYPSYRCSVAGNTNAGEAGIRASMCMIATDAAFHPVSSTCLEAH
jgi:hypothetical protein